jgi:2-methylcitrate dehydratase PrpD
MPSPSIQDRIAEFATTASESWAGRKGDAAVLSALVDTLAVGLAGRREPVTKRVLAYAQSLREAGEASAWVASQRFAPETAALVNGVAAHALDYDDVAPAWRGHPSAVLFPTLLALAEDKPLTGADLIDAYTVGFEVGARLGRACAQAQYRKGWHTTATIGVIAAAAAGVRFLRLNPQCGSAALGLAVAQAAGPQANFGTTAKPMHAGFAAAAAVRAVRLAAMEVDASATALDGPRGFVDLYGDGITLDQAFRTLGETAPALHSEGPERKAYPSCYATHHGIAATLALCDEHTVDPHAVAAIEIEGSAGSHAALLTRLPRDTTEAKFSLEYAISLVLLNRSVHLGSFSDQAFRRGDLHEMMTRVAVTEAAGPVTPRYSRVRLAMRNGRAIETTVTALDTRPEPDRLAAKVADCLSFAGLGGDGCAFCSDILALAGHPLTRFTDALDRVLGGRVGPSQHPRHRSNEPATDSA